MLMCYARSLCSGIDQTPSGMARKTIFQYILVVALLQWTMAGLIPNKARWFEILDSPPLERRTTPVQDYWIRLKEGTSYVQENIRIDTVKETERFHIFPFDNVEESIMLNDFKKNRTIIKIPKTNQCFVQKLNPSVPPPRKLQSSILKIIAFNGTNNTVNIDISEKSTWKVQIDPFDRRLLSTEMNNLCSNIPVYEIIRTSGQLYLKGLKRQGRSPSFPRAPCGGRVCSYFWQWFCKGYIPGKGCIWVRVKVSNCQDITC